MNYKNQAQLKICNFYMWNSLYISVFQPILVWLIFDIIYFA